jgi:hypothetical protein
MPQANHPVRLGADGEMQKGDAVYSMGMRTPDFLAKSMASG